MTPEAKRQKHAARERLRRAAVRAAHPWMKPFRQTIDNVLSKLELREECWIWTGATDAKGYGTVGWDRKTYRAHRLIYEILRGPVGEGLELDHLCRVPPCCNPKHLDPVHHRTNILRGVGMGARNAKKTHCPRGHVYDRTLRNGWRWCWTCTRETRRAAAR